MGNPAAVVGDVFDTEIRCKCCLADFKADYIKPIKDKQSKITNAFAAVNLLDENGHMKLIYSSEKDDNGQSLNHDAFQVFNQRAYTFLDQKYPKLANGYRAVHAQIFKQLLREERNNRMKIAFNMRNNFFTLRDDMTSTWDQLYIRTMVADKDGDGNLMCPVCGAHNGDSKDLSFDDMEITAVGNGRTWHMGIGKEDIFKENRMYSFRDQFSDGIYIEDDYVVTEERDLDVLGWVNEDIKDGEIYGRTIKAQEAEDKFYEIAPYHTLESISKAMSREMWLIGEIVVEYYGTKDNLKLRSNEM